MAESAPLSIGLCAQIACILDVAACKPGNVCFVHDHADMTSVDFLLSAAAIAPIMEEAPHRPVGTTILESIRATRQVTKVNTNLGIVLLLAPLASVPPTLDLRDGLIRSLKALTVDDARAAYDAIRLANPGGLGSAETQDVSTAPTVTLREAMNLAADRDLVARQYVNNFEQVFEGVELLRTEMRANRLGLRAAITSLFLRLLAKYPDSLIARKSGLESASEVSQAAARLLETKDDAERIALQTSLEQKNAGTTADLVTASLFVALRTGMIELPLDSQFRTDH